jgi:hypothetical protein
MGLFVNNVKLKWIFFFYAKEKSNLKSLTKNLNFDFLRYLPNS